MHNCLISGVGGQGTVLASKLLAEAALEKGLNVRTTETIGMAQRGGSVVSHVRMGEIIHSPLIPHGKADVIIALEPAEAVRVLHFLADGGSVFVCDTAIKPSVGENEGYNAQKMLDYLRARVGKLTIVDGAKVSRHCGSVKPLNTAMLGAAVGSGVFPFGLSDIERVIGLKIPQKHHDINIKALNYYKAV